MIDNQVALQLETDSPGNVFAMAMGNGAEHDEFITFNIIFANFFPGIRTTAQLRALITNKSENKTVVMFNDGCWELLEFFINDKEILFLLKNISFEMLALKQLKKQLKELSSSNDMFTKILGKELPVGIMVVDKSYNVSFVNHTLKGFFSIPFRLNLKKCYNYVKGIRPCESCIMESVKIDNHKNKKTFILNNGSRMVTSQIHPAGDDFIIIFRETTKEINLIKEIKKQQEALENANGRIAEQNGILKGLSNINVRMGQMRNLDAILEMVVDSITGTFVCEKAAILLFNETGKIKNAHFTSSIDDWERNSIIDSIVSNSSQGVSGIPIHQSEPIYNPDDYTIQDMFNREKLIGRLYLHKPEKAVDQSILELFLMQVSSYLENLELQRKLEEIAQADGLTGVFNRYYFDKRFEEESDLSRRFGQPLSLILVDVNGLKEVNDNVGHEAGDMLLEQTARLLNSNISSFDSIYRIGGDEFVILMSNCAENQLQVMMNMFKELQEVASFDYQEQQFPIRFSLGGSCSTEVQHKLLKDESDKRMYQDKENYYKTHRKYR
jgi:diguanylate cyclase (GGDEF)-like protein